MAKLLQARCNGQHEHERLEGSSRTKPGGILSCVTGQGNPKQGSSDQEDENGMQIWPRTRYICRFLQCFGSVKTILRSHATRKSMSKYDINPPIDVAWDSVLVRRTIDRKTGVVMAEDVRCSMEQAQLQRSFKGEVPKEVLTVFLFMARDSNCHATSIITSPGNKTRYEAISGELLHQYSQNIRLVPRSTYRKAIGEGVEDDYLWVPTPLMQLVENQASM